MSVSGSVSLSACQSVGQSVHQDASQSVSQPVNKSVVLTVWASQFYISFPSMLKKDTIRCISYRWCELCKWKLMRKWTKFLTTVPTKFDIFSFQILNFEKFWTRFGWSSVEFKQSCCLIKCSFQPKCFHFLRGWVEATFLSWRFFFQKQTVFLGLLLCCYL